MSHEQSSLPSPAHLPPPHAVRVTPSATFRYSGYRVNREARQLLCHYEVGTWRFTETFTFSQGDNWDDASVTGLLRLLYLAAGVSYYKTHAPLIVDLDVTPITALERQFLQQYYTQGLGEFAYRNGLDLTSLKIVGGRPHISAESQRENQAATPGPRHPLVPFGGGLDSIVSVEMLRPHADVSLFVVSHAGDRFAAIEDPAEVSGRPIVRVERQLDPQLYASTENGFLNGHVPITGIISLAALAAAALSGHDAVVMSNEWSASSATIVVDGREINHQYSKSATFELALTQVVDEIPGAPSYFSLLRSRSELWIARYFASHCDPYLYKFRSCNRAFQSDREIRADRWCGRCDKCAFIDVILAPFLPADTLRRIFDGREPLENPEMLPVLKSLVDHEAKPWECVGDIHETAAAIRLAIGRDDRRRHAPEDTSLLHILAETIPPELGTAEDVERLLAHLPTINLIPDEYAAVLE